MYMAILLCTNVCMYKRINKKNCATFLIKKRDKNHLYYILSYFELYVCSVFFFFSTIKRQLWLHYYLFVNITQRNDDVFLLFSVAYSKLCVSAICVFGFLTYFINLGHLREQYCYAPYPSSSVSRLTRVSVWEFTCANVDGLVY